MAKEPAKPRTKSYKLREGVGKHYLKNEEDGVRTTEVVNPGDTVQLTDAQYRSFQDKFDPVSGKDNTNVDPPNSATKPTVDERNNPAAPAPSADEAAKANKENEPSVRVGTGKDARNTEPGEKTTGAGASENSANKATVPSGGSQQSQSPNTVPQQQNKS